jgi:hypothetical protein
MSLYHAHTNRTERSMRRDISNTADILDSRDIISRIEELESELSDAYDAHMIERAEEQREPITFEQWLTFNADRLDFALQSEAIELQVLRAVASQGEGYGDWEHGETLIRESYFETYARELADDIGAVKDDAGWPGRHIDWEAAAKELKADYTEVDFDGVTYLMRA